MSEDFKVLVDSEKCIQCRLCAIECPSKTAGTNEILANQFSPHCDRCFHCYAICPQDAIQVEGVEKVMASESPQIEYPQLLQFLKDRRSIRKFNQEPVPNKYLNLLTDTTKYSPTGGNAQDFSITIINNQETRRELEDEIINYYDRIVRMLRFPVVRFFMKFFGDAKVKETARDDEFFIKIEDIYSRMKAGEKNIFYNAPVVMLFHTRRLLPTAMEDCILGAYNVVLAATSLGLGTCFVSLSQQAISSSRSIKRGLDIPRDDIVYVVLVLGFPAINYRRIPPRRDKNLLYR
jgi:nitroreductase/Pyruvate/2-oxoacid:ferredoxin oxidoreductase delta subunit